ncbi:hypothetical protein [Collimonas antrihumi]|uniref:hypothetical protein n=1 Tax=Collimonas antrihumi TaxID=1940615 RepID=UPI001B8D26C6|nr:hypothetical protein [Collimonas antrihumi]
MTTMEGDVAFNFGPQMTKSYTLKINDMKKTLISLAAVITLVGCHNSPLKPEDALVKQDKIYASKLITPAPGTVPVLIQRPAAHLGWPWTAYIYVDGKYAAEMDNGQRMSIHLPFGRHQIGVKVYDSNAPAGPLREVEVSIVEGDTYAFKVFLPTYSGFEIQRDYQPG